jgi:Xaa-Pro aminopeptidase
MSRRASLLSLLAPLLLAVLPAGHADAAFAFDGAALTGTAPSRGPAAPASPAAAPATSAFSQSAPRVPRADTSERADSTEQTDPDAPAAAADRLPPRFHARRRRAVLEALPPDAVAVLFSSPRRTREKNIRYPYRQNSNLYYLTGATAPASVLILAPGGLRVGRDTTKEVLFVPPSSRRSERWTGPRPTPAQAERVLGVEKALPHTRFADVLERAVQAPTGRDGRRFFHLPLPYGIEEDSELAKQVAAFRDAARLMPEATSPLTRRAVEVMRTVDRPEAFDTFQRQFSRRLSADAFQTAFLRRAYRQFTGAASLEAWTRWRSEHFGPTRADGQRLQTVLARLRQQKTSAEQHLVRRAAQITAEAQKAALRAIEPGAHEYEVAAAAEYVITKNGAEATAFPSVVGSGKNASVLQYHDNRRRMQRGELVVVNVGAEYHGYAADVTRTAPVDGSFSKRQRALYTLVLKAQKAAIRAARPGNNFRNPRQVARRILGNGLAERGLIDTPDDVGRYLTPSTSHYLGLSVHDAGRGGPLEPGAVLAIETGLHLPASSGDLPKRWRGLSVRIGDDVLVTEDGPVVLSKDAPREIDALEALMRQPRSL